MALNLMEAQPDLPAGPTYKCTECGARVRGPLGLHVALRPWPHETVLVHVLPADFEAREEAAAEARLEEARRRRDARLGRYYRRAS